MTYLLNAFIYVLVSFPVGVITYQTKHPKVYWAHHARLQSMLARESTWQELRAGSPIAHVYSKEPRTESVRACAHFQVTAVSYTPGFLV